MKMKFSVPNKLSEITLGQYQKYLKLLEDNPDEGTNTLFVKTKMLEIFCNIPYADLHQIKVKDIDEVVQIIFDTLESDPGLPSTFQMGDLEFGFIPKLDDMTFGEYVDLDTYIGNWKEMQKAMAVLYRPVKAKKDGRYLIEKYRGDNFHNIMINMPLDAVFGSIVFFYHLGIDCSKGMMNYLEDQANNTELGKDLDRNGVGINQYTHLLKGILDDLKVSLN
jgi:hypothetical protein